MNLNNHAYFNLAGDGNILKHEVMISAEVLPHSTRLSARQSGRGHTRSQEWLPSTFGDQGEDLAARRQYVTGVYDTQY